MSLGLLPGLRVLAQPDYSDVPGGRGPFYRSVLVAREGEAVPVPEVSGAAIPEIGRRAATGGQHAPFDVGLDRSQGRCQGSAGTGSVRPARAGGSARPVGGRDGRCPCCAGEEEENALEIVETGGHRASIRAVAEGRADLAAIDCRAWALALRHEPCARDWSWSAGRRNGPGLPFVTGAGTDDKTAARLRETLIGMGCHPPQERDI
jgi:hypothetical protein